MRADRPTGVWPRQQIAHTFVCVPVAAVSAAKDHVNGTEITERTTIVQRSVIV